MLATMKDRKINDLVDFYRHWPEVRAQAQNLQARRDIGDDQREILKWMIRVVDRVGPSDLSEEV
ncbi:hypothetical protein SAMN05216196_102213 [Lutimaribacter pacificus]|uniref:Uncharacterized protein n=1 Tax=Lutimaribacter pacificus TaxID=391948 RepID=A0A1H0EI30_9RHOB|nr:hypothetical protein [Lutimaribacter pacificus]SDN81936.1 hypothetical protein SAMN05216196_102213 [Lutimaribacter pacificus]SHK52890.1 hypothetical protein SAMN05444142_10675 [Lutimaribacter pacificus]